jgi:hypothetical protein
MIAVSMAPPALRGHWPFYSVALSASASNFAAIDAFGGEITVDW